MGSTTQTPFLNLPVFSDDDRPTWRGDLNGAFNSIDAGYGTLSGDISNLTLKKVDKGALFVSLSEHGAIGDGVSDDTGAFSAALNYASATGAKVVLVPNGTYSVSAIQMPTNVALIGQGSATINARACATLVNCDVNAQNVSIENLTFNLGGNVSSYAVQANTGAQNFVVNNCSFIDNWATQAIIEIRDSTSNIFVTNCRFNGCSDSVRINKNPSTVIVENNRFTNWKGRPIYVLGSAGFAASNIIISKNVITNPAAFVTSDTRQPICFSGVDSDPFYNVVIKDNIITGNSHSFTDTATPGVADLISLHQCINFCVSDNVLRFGGDGGITVALECRQGVVSNNVIEGTDSVGIFIGSNLSTYTTDVNVVGNTIINCGQNRIGDRPAINCCGVWVYSARAINIASNRFADNQATPTMQFGVSLRGTSTQIDLNANSYVGCVGQVNKDSSVLITRFNSVLVANKQGATTITNTTATANDPHLTLAVDANATYLFEAFILYSSSATADFSAGYSAPAGAALIWSADAVNVGDTSNASNATISRAGADINSTLAHGGAGSQSVVAKHSGRLVVGTTPGNFVMRWAQYVAEASNSTVLPGSWLKLTRIS